MNKKLQQHLSSKKNQLFVFVLALALCLRLQGIKNGLPYVLDPTESSFVEKILYLPSSFFNPRPISVPYLFIYLNALVVFLSQGTFEVSNLLTNLEVNPANFYLLLRVMSMLFGVGLVVVIYFIGSKFNSLVALLSSSFLAVSLLHVKYSQAFQGFSPMVFFSLLSTFFALKVLAKRSSVYIVLSTLFAVLSASMHYIGVVSIVPLFFALALSKERGRVFRFPLILFFTLFFLLNPYSFFYFFHLLYFVVKSYASSYYNYESSSYLLYLFNFLLYGVGPVVWVSAFGLLKYKEDYNLDALKVLFSLPVIYFGILGFFHLTSGGYGVLLVPYFCLASGLVFNLLLDKSKVGQLFQSVEYSTSVQRFACILLLLFAFWIPLKYTLKYNSLLSLFDTRVLATEWIKGNTSSDYKIAWDKNSLQVNWFDAYNKGNLKKLLDDPDILVSKQRYPITLKLLKRERWHKILKKKIDYVVINSLDYERILRGPNRTLEKKYYNHFLKLTPLVTFNPYLVEKEKQMRSLPVEDLYSPFHTLWQRERTGPLIKIYKL